MYLFFFTSFSFAADTNCIGDYVILIPTRHVKRAAYAMRTTNMTKTPYYAHHKNSVNSSR